MHYPCKCVIDTNVPKTANLSISVDSIPVDEIQCVEQCITFIQYIVKNGTVVLDSNGEIFSEYCKQLSLRGIPGLGDYFMKWLHDNRWGFPDKDRVSITKNGDTYSEFPQDSELSDFDKADMKFVAVANAHEEKPPIVQATDAKWWKWSKTLQKKGITVFFMEPALVEKNCRKKNRCGDKMCSDC